jgi:hypothetical protein
MLARTQESAISASATAMYPDVAGVRSPECGPVSEPPNLFKGALAENRIPPNVQSAQLLLANITGGEVEDDTVRLYLEISALSLKKRRAAFRNASPNQKSLLWRTHLALFLVKRPEFNEWQRAIIYSAMELVTADYFDVRSDDPAWKTKVQEPSRSLELQILNAFSRLDAAKIFATLGDDAESAKSNASLLLKNIYQTPLSDSGPYKQVILTKLVADDFELEQTSCECSTSSDYCSIWSACRSGGCATTADGCGTFWSYPCNGACR